MSAKAPTPQASQEKQEQVERPDQAGVSAPAGQIDQNAAPSLCYVAAERAPVPHQPAYIAEEVAVADAGQEPGGGGATPVLCTAAPDCPGTTTTTTAAAAAAAASLKHSGLPLCQQQHHQGNNSTTPHVAASGPPRQTVQVKRGRDQGNSC